MPIYEYACEVCGERFEVRQPFNSAGEVRCPAGHGPVHRVFSPPVIVFKGSGFYVTDHRKGSATNGSARSPKKSQEKDKAGAREAA